jgi:hypothetical protein
MSHAALDWNGAALFLLEINSYHRDLRGCGMRRLSFLVLILVLHTMPFVAFSQKTDPALKPLAFLSGRWTNDSAEGQEEEYWSQATGRSMIGTFRVMRDGDAFFYEFWSSR